MSDWIDRQSEIELIKNQILTSTKGFSISINGPWGSGKSWFLDNLAISLTDDIKIIKYNAWEHELYNEPFTSIFQAIYQYMLENDKVFKTKKDKENIKEGFIKALKLATPLLTRIVLGKAIDVEKLKDGKDSLFNIFDNVATDIFDELKNKDTAIKEFKEMLNGYIQRIQKKGVNHPPLVILIDELDRCNPQYIIQFLQNIFHFFSCDNLILVFALDISQVYSSISHFYGEKCHPEGYLRKIIDIQYNLRTISSRDIKSFIFKYYDANISNLSQLKHMVKPLTTTGSPLIKIIDKFELSLRDYERLLTILRCQENNIYFKEIYAFIDIVVLLDIIQLKNNILFRLILSKDTENALKLLLATFPFLKIQVKEEMELYEIILQLLFIMGYSKSEGLNTIFNQHFLTDFDKSLIIDVTFLAKQYLSKDLTALKYVDDFFKQCTFLA